MNIFFRAFEIEDAEFINALRDNEDMESRIGGNKRFVSLARERKWIEDIIYGDYKDKIHLAICENGSKDIIGYLSISEIDHFNKSCLLSGIKLDLEFSKKGYGIQAFILILRYVFEQLGMERCTSICLEDHLVMKKIMERVGFKIEGLLRHSLFKNGTFQNQYLFSILKEDYFERKKKLQ
ncbi:GNAT family N-acetyltransferase [Ancylomarina sp. DW003]|nr:GNAT family protein [Ancylomarina sp. DW003]MDE5423400.1 GNAT family N-acetyltransferase [Ancylomarina sp. DW003]